MPADTSIGLLPPFLPTAFPLNLCVSKGCEALCLHRPWCPIATVRGHFSPLARLEQGTCREWKGAEALMQLSVKDCEVECSFCESQGRFLQPMLDISCLLSSWKHPEAGAQFRTAVVAGLCCQTVL